MVIVIIDNLKTFVRSWVLVTGEHLSPKWNREGEGGTVPRLGGTASKRLSICVPSPHKGY